jgi:hypothetical protein
MQTCLRMVHCLRRIASRRSGLCTYITQCRALPVKLRVLCQSLLFPSKSGAARKSRLHAYNIFRMPDDLTRYQIRLLSSCNLNSYFRDW